MGETGEGNKQKTANYKMLVIGMEVPHREYNQKYCSILLW